MMLLSHSGLKLIEPAYHGLKSINVLSFSLCMSGIFTPAIEKLINIMLLYFTDEDTEAPSSSVTWPRLHGKWMVEPVSDLWSRLYALSHSTQLLQWLNCCSSSERTANIRLQDIIKISSHPYKIHRGFVYCNKMKITSWHTTPVK